MKQIIVLLMALAFPISMLTQPWMELAPKEKIETNSLTFFDYTRAFNDYWAPKNVVDGYYYNNGIKEKAGGWKQFKRWEWYWENRVDPTTGEFPSTSAFEELQKINKSDNTRSSSGNWTSMGPDNSPGGYAGLGRLNCIGFHPTDNNTYYVGAAAGGVWKTTDNGTTWTSQAGDIEAIGISDIVVHETTGDDIVYIATGDRDHSDTYSVGVMKSTDGGTTWITTGLTYTADQKKLINRLLNDPLDNDIFYAATSEGLYKSTDACDTWNLINGTTFQDLEFKPGNPNVVYASTKYGDIYRSLDAGNNWSEVLATSGRRTELAVSDNDATVVYALVAATNSGLYGIYKSTDSGANFSVTYNGPNLLGWQCSGGDSGGQAWYDLCMAADPNNADIVYIGGVNTWKSADGGNNWNINNHWSSTCSGQATNVHADKHSLNFQNGSSTLFECNDGGVYYTNDNGNSWNHITSGMAISQMYRLGVAQTTDDDVITGLQDNGTKALLNNSWEDVIGGDGMECLIDWSDENTQYGSLYYGAIYRTTNHWSSSTQIDGGISGSAAWVTPYIQDPNNSNTIYVGYQDVWKSTNQGNSWTQLSSWYGNTLRSLAVAPSNSDYIFAATTNQLYSTTDGGATWNDITGTIPTWSGNITYISVKDDDPNTIWVSLGEFNTDGVYESTDGGSTWTNISTGLPQLPVNCVIQNKQNTSEVELYAGTDVGVYIKLGTDDWTAFFDGMPNVVVTELEIYYDDSNPANSLIRAATFGRGLWESDLYSTVNPPVADFIGDPTSGNAPLMVNFTDLSTGSITSWDWDFGDGNSSTDQNPTNTYITEGTYTVSLTVTGPDGNSTETKTDYIVVSTDAPIADFEGTPTNGTVPLEVSFTDLSTGGTIDTWEWEFGDTGISSEQNPVHIYSAAGTYTVTLTVTGPGGSSTETKTDYITVTPPPPTTEFFGEPTAGNSPLYVDFTNESTGEIDSYLWDFGDGNTSTDINPNHTYSSAGSYDVMLIAYGPGGNDTITKENYISVIPPAPVADFMGDPTFGDAPLTVQFTDQTTGEVDSWLWDFGDGGTSSLPNPSYTFIAPGNYDVSLEASGPGGIGYEIKYDYILIPVGTQNNTDHAILVYPNPASDEINISFHNAVDRKIRIISLGGIIVEQRSISTAKERINVSELAEGTYTIEIIENELITRVKFVKK